MHTQKEVVNELEFIEHNYTFSDKCTGDLREYLFNNGLVKSYDGALQLTNNGELAVGYNPEDLGIFKDDETETDHTRVFEVDEEFDPSEAFFYNEFEGEQDEQF